MRRSFYNMCFIQLCFTHSAYKTSRRTYLIYLADMTHVRLIYCGAHMLIFHKFYTRGVLACIFSPKLETKIIYKYELLSLTFIFPWVSLFPLDQYQYIYIYIYIFEKMTNINLFVISYLFIYFFAIWYKHTYFIDPSREPKRPFPSPNGNNATKNKFSFSSSLVCCLNPTVSLFTRNSYDCFI